MPPLAAAGGGLAADISLGVENGAHAVDFVRRQVLAVPPLRPLCLAVKAFLRWGSWLGVSRLRCCCELCGL
jgi:hypothetical protein